MSLICIGIVHGVPAGKATELLKNELEVLARSLSIGVQFDGFFQEPFIESYEFHKGIFAFNIADNFSYLNCEHLLRADWCNAEEESEWGTLRERLNKINAMLRCAYEYGSQAELFIGESGDELDDFQQIYTSLDDMRDDIVAAYREAKMEPCVHLLIRRHQKSYKCTIDPESGESSCKRVVQTFERETYEIVKVTYGGETITTTPTHPFYVPEKGWTEAIKLRAGDILVKNNGEYVVVEKVQHEILEAPITVYNFEVEDYHTYYVAASADSDLFVLVHNRCGTSYELSDNQLRNFGHKGKTSGYRVTHGSHENAMDFVLTQTNGLIEYSPGKYVGYNSRGVEFRIYPRSGYTYTSIRINGISGLKGIKFIWDQQTTIL